MDDAVSAAATAEAEGDEHQDAGDANWGEILVYKRSIFCECLIIEILKQF